MPRSNNLKKTSTEPNQPNETIILEESKEEKPKKERKKKQNASTDEVNTQIEESAQVVTNHPPVANIVVETLIESTEVLEVVKPKRGRKPNKVVVEEVVSEIGEQDEENVKQVAKKRGRKPKGGKIVQQLVLTEPEKGPKQNIILHLKCCMNDLQTTNAVENSQIESYNFPTNKNDLSFDILDPIQKNGVSGSNYTNNEIASNTNIIDEKEEETFVIKNANKEIWKKIKILERDLHSNNIGNKKSCCFWDTHEFDNLPVYIPKHFIKNTYNVYGCFCSPECATAHLMHENIDSSVKFERYHLLNYIYGKVYNYTCNIKPAPDPHYMLDKFYGNLSIQEYRSLLKKERLFLIVDKPLTRILPELHEDNDDYILNNKVIPSNTQHSKKKQAHKVATNDHFGIID